MKERGQVLILALVVVGLVLVNTLVIIGGASILSQNSNYSLAALQALNLAEAGVDKALAALNATSGSYLGETETFLGGGSYSTVITSVNVSTKIIESTGYIPSKSNPRARRTVKITVSKGVGASFSYGLQVGEGGITLGTNSAIGGSVYSNGDIKLGNGSNIAGDAYVAGGTATSSDQQSDCAVPGCADFAFGESINSQDRQSVAQSFTPSLSGVLGKVSLKLKKVGSPPDLTVRVMANKNNKPDKNQILASGTLLANLVSGEYSFVDVTFSVSPRLDEGSSYWIVLTAASLDNNHYWLWSADNLQSYSRGSAVWSSDWQGSWTAINFDLGFKTYMGGKPTSISGDNGVTVSGDAHAHILKDLTVSKGAYYQVMDDVRAASYHPSSADPAPKPMPISDANIQAWKDAAVQRASRTGNINSCPAVFGPGKYIGNVSLPNSCTVTIVDPIWITGNLNFGNSDILKLDPSYGPSSGVMVIDGTINFGNTDKLQGSGADGSFLVLVSTFDSRGSEQTAVDVGNGTNQGILYAPLGIVGLINNANLNQLSAWRINLGNGVILNYQTGLASVLFSGGPSGTYSLVRGTYQVK